MIDDLLSNEFVKRFILDIKKSEKYFLKKFDDIHRYPFEISKEIVLFTFYEALFKYKIIISDEVFLNDYLNDLDRLFKKIVNFQDINDGINKLICKFVASKLRIADMSTPEAREKIVTYIFNNYCINGYLYHGFSTVYENDLKEVGFIPGVYNNLYSKMREVNKIYKKYNDEAFCKDFSNYQVYFTDNFVDACYYSLYSPKYFYKYLIDTDEKSKLEKRIYLDNNFDKCFSDVKKYLEKEFEETDRNKVKEIINEEWDLLNSVNRKASLMIVKRNIIDEVDVSLLDKLLASDENLYELVDRLLCSKCKTIGFSNTLRKEDYDIFSIDYKDKVMEEKKVEVKEEIIEKQEEQNVMEDVSGSVTVLMLLGSLFVSLGVIVTVVMMLRG